MHTMAVPVSELSLDLNNYRSTPQPDEVSAVKAMIATSPTRFWALMDSLIEDGYLPNENIIVLIQSGKKVVMEGNRRVAVLKLLNGLLTQESLEVPEGTRTKIAALNVDWKVANSAVPCSVYDEVDTDLVDRVISRIHGKNDKTGRDNWESIARARHNRDKNGGSEPELDLLEKFLQASTELSGDQKLRWEGQYPISVLEEALKRVAPRLGCSSARDLADRYPSVNYHAALGQIILAIGRRSVGFPVIRGNDNWFVKFGIPAQDNTQSSTSATSSSQGSSYTSSTAGANEPSADMSAQANPGASVDEKNSSSEDHVGGVQKKQDGAEAKTAHPNESSAQTDGLETQSDDAPRDQGVESPGATEAAEAAEAAADQDGSNEEPANTGDNANSNDVETKKRRKVSAVPLEDPRAVKRALKNLKIYGNDSGKIQSLKIEAYKLNLETHPTAFCFLLRSLFELSAKAYADQHSISLYDHKKNRDLSLVDSLRKIVDYLTQQKKDMQMLKKLHGPMEELAIHDGILSITAMNQLVHNLRYISDSTQIPVAFARVFPLLEEMNK